MSDVRCEHCGQLIPDPADIPHACHFSPQQAAIYGRILDGGGVTISDIISSLWPSPEAEPPAAEQVVRNQIWRMRERMVPTSWEIVSRGGRVAAYRIEHREPRA